MTELTGSTKTMHTLYSDDARRMSAVPDASVHLIVTSPPYPMIEMWDATFAELSPGVEHLIAGGRGMEAFESMHRVLDGVWAECQRVLVPGGFACINVGDATRSLGGEFCLYPNHARIVMAMLGLGMTSLPDILWRKPTNVPNKFMGSGMLPAGAYVTYEHEYILIFRKGGKRDGFDVIVRGESAFFWEERNVWFSDVWTDLRGTSQRIDRDGLRERSGAFPFELPYRLINMYALAGETVLDPFAGTCTTLAAAIASGRNSVGYERVGGLRSVASESMVLAADLGRKRAAERLAAHVAFMGAWEKPVKHVSKHYGFPVITKQEVGIRLTVPVRLEPGEGGVEVEHAYLESPRPTSVVVAAGPPGEAIVERAGVEGDPSTRAETLSRLLSPRPGEVAGADALVTSEQIARALHPRPFVPPYPRTRR